LVTEFTVGGSIPQPPSSPPEGEESQIVDEALDTSEHEEKN
jgi:hypothetical protein